jgi:hypothetical protein
MTISNMVPNDMVFLLVLDCSHRMKKVVRQKEFQWQLFDAHFVLDRFHAFDAARNFHRLLDAGL